MFYLSLCCQLPSLHWESQSTSPPWDALQHCAGLWIFCGASQTLIWSYSCVFLPPMSTAIPELVCFLLWEVSVSFHIFNRNKVCLVDCVDLIWSLYSWWEGLGSSSLATYAPVFQMWFYFYLWMWVIHWGLLVRVPWRTWVWPCEGQVWRWCSCLGHRGSRSTRYSGGLVAREARNIVL